MIYSPVLFSWTFIRKYLWY